MEKKEKDTLEKIVLEAIEREKQINIDHPERHGYGMIEGEANDLIRRIEVLEYKLLRSQKEKIKLREDKIRVIGRDKLYTMSPEEYLIIKEMHKPIINAEERVYKRLPDRTRQIYLLKEQGLTQEEIAKRFNIHRSTVSREIKRAVNAFKKEISGGDRH